MKRFLLIIFVVLALSSSSAAQEERQGVNLYRYVYINPGNGGDSVFSSIEVQLSPVELLNKEASNKAAKYLFETVTGDLSFSEEEQVEDRLLDACVQFERTCRDANSEEWKASWDFFASSSPLFIGKNVATIELDEEMYTGGAHPLHSSALYNFNPQTGELIGNDDLIADSTGLKVAVEAAFWKMVSEGFGEDVGKEEFFWGGDFYMPSVMGLSDEGMIFIYNEYEAAPYVYGTLYVLLSFDEVRPFLKPNLLDK